MIVTVELCYDSVSLGPVSRNASLDLLILLEFDRW